MKIIVKSIILLGFIVFSCSAFSLDATLSDIKAIIKDVSGIEEGSTILVRKPELYGNYYGLNTNPKLVVKEIRYDPKYISIHIVVVRNDIVVVTGRDLIFLSSFDLLSHSSSYEELRTKIGTWLSSEFILASSQEQAVADIKTTFAENGLKEGSTLWLKHKENNISALSKLIITNFDYDPSSSNIIIRVKVIDTNQDVELLCSQPPNFRGFLNSWIQDIFYTREPKKVIQQVAISNQKLIQDKELLKQYGIYEGATVWIKDDYDGDLIIKKYSKITIYKVIILGDDRIHVFTDKGYDLMYESSTDLKAWVTRFFYLQDPLQQ